MLFTRREFALGALAAFLADDPMQEVAHLLQKSADTGWLASAEISGSVIDVCHGSERFTMAFGTAASPSAVFRISSITKPMIATATMVLSDRGVLNLQNRVTKFLPEFRGESKDEVTVQHLLTHTSGLPDNLPHIRGLLRNQASLDVLFDEALKLPLLFKPGNAVSYSNLGVLLLKAILERLTQKSLRSFLKQEVFLPLSMEATSLGLGGRKVESVVPHQPRADGVDLNTSYLLDLGTPWGGVLSTASDLTRFLHYFANPATAPLRKATAFDMLRNHNEGLYQPWGIGWMLARSHDVYYKVPPDWRRYGWHSFIGNPELLPAFGSNCSPRTFGHYGVSGTLAWVDPDRRVSLVLLTTREVSQSRDGVLGTVSDSISRLV